MAKLAQPQKQQAPADPITLHNRKMAALAASLGQPQTTVTAIATAKVLYTVCEKDGTAWTGDAGCPTCQENEAGPIEGEDADLGEQIPMHKVYRNRTGRTVHERHTDTYWQPGEIKDPACDHDIQMASAQKLALAVKSGILEEIMVKGSGGIAFGITKEAPKPSNQGQPPVTGEQTEVKDPAKKEDKKEEGEKADDAPTPALPDGITMEQLSEEQKAIVADPSFALLPAEQQKSILEATAPEVVAPAATVGASDAEF